MELGHSYGFICLLWILIDPRLPLCPHLLYSPVLFLSTATLTSRSTFFPSSVCVWIHCVAASACICVIKCAATFYVTWCAPPEKCKCTPGPYHNNWRGRLWCGDWRSFQLLTAIMCNFVFLCSRALIQTNKSIYEANCPSEQCMSLEITVKHVTTSQHTHTHTHRYIHMQVSRVQLTGLESSNTLMREATSIKSKLLL